MKAAFLVFSVILTLGEIVFCNDYVLAGHVITDCYECGQFWVFSGPFDFKNKARLMIAGDSAGSIVNAPNNDWMNSIGLRNLQVRILGIRGIRRPLNDFIWGRSTHPKIDLQLLMPSGEDNVPFLTALGEHPFLGGWRFIAKSGLPFRRFRKFILPPLDVRHFESHHNIAGPDLSIIDKQNGKSLRQSLFMERNGVQNPVLWRVAIPRSAH